MHSRNIGLGFIRLFVVLSSMYFGTSAATFAQSAADVDGKATTPAAGSQVKGKYFGQSLPGDTPVPFAPSVLSAVSPWVEATDFSPDGTQCFLSVGAANYSSAKLLYSRLVDGVWTPFEAAPFVSDFTYSNEPVFSKDGTTLTFTGTRGTGTKDLWTVRYADRAWRTPVALPSAINSDGQEFRGSVMSDGTMYFGRIRSGMMQVYKAQKNSAGEMLVEMLDAPVNAQSYEGDPCVAEDGRFLIFNSGRDRRSADLYVSFADGRGGWGAPIKLGPEFNSASHEYGAHLSSDGKYLFFTRHSAEGNGIYWVAISAIEKLKP